METRAFSHGGHTHSNVLCTKAKVRPKDFNVWFEIVFFQWLHQFSPVVVDRSLGFFFFNVRWCEWHEMSPYFNVTEYIINFDQGLDLYQRCIDAVSRAHPPISTGSSSLNVRYINVRTNISTMMPFKISRLSFLFSSSLWNAFWSLIMIFSFRFWWLVP